jgi:hypothetical protein
MESRAVEVFRRRHATLAQSFPAPAAISRACPPPAPRTCRTAVGPPGNGGRRRPRRRRTRRRLRRPRLPTSGTCVIVLPTNGPGRVPSSAVAGSLPAPHRRPSPPGKRRGPSPRGSSSPPVRARLAAAASDRGTRRLHSPGRSSAVLSRPPSALTSAQSRRLTVRQLGLWTHFPDQLRAAGGGASQPRPPASEVATQFGRIGSSTPLSRAAGGE